MNCKYKRIRTKQGIKYGYCLYNKVEVDLFKCDCSNKKYKTSNLSSELKTTLKMPKNKVKKQVKSYKVRKLEKHRTISLLTNDMNHCYICGKPKECIHEVYSGTNRLNSMKYNCIVPLCTYHHNGSNEGVHFNSKLNHQLRKECQIKFEETYTDINFIDIFHKNYKD